MRLRIVVRSLAVILASPLVALPMGQAQEPARPIAVQPVMKQTPKAMVYQAKAVTPKPAAEPTEVSIACGGDGCVVQSGLEVMVVAGKRAR